MASMQPEGLGAKQPAKPSLDVEPTAEPGPGGDVSPAGSRGSSQSLWMRVFTVQDGIMIGYLVIVTLLLWRADPSAANTTSARGVYLCLSAVVFGTLIARGVTDIPAAVRGVIYRIVMIGAILYNYLALRDLLPIIRPDTVDAKLLAIDKAIFGVEPALWLERFNHRPIVEWFSFFYFSYFLICLCYALIPLCIARMNRYTTELALGVALVYSIGQLGYMAVPGYGPIRYLEHEFAGPINGGFWWSCVWATVQAGSAMKDIFPSLHTAGPLYFALYALRRAKEEPRWLWPGRITAFFSANIIISTVFLRWHYAIDVFAGIALAVSVRWAVPRIVTWEERRRARFGSPGAWIFR
jgi:hypothetical protein